MWNESDASSRPALLPFRLSALAVALIAALLLAMPQLKYAALHASFYDLGQYANDFSAVLVTGDAAYNLVGHAHVIAPLYAWLFAFWPSPVTLLLLQSLVLATTALLAGVLWRFYGAGRLIDGALLYLLSISVWFNALFDFHFEHLIFPAFLGAALAAEINGRWSAVLVVLCALILCMTKEVYPLMAVGLGLHLILGKRRYVLGVLVLVMSLGYFLAVTGLVIPHYAGGAAAPALWNKAFGYLGGNFREMLGTIFTQPLMVARELASPRKLLYVTAILGAFAFVGLRAPSLLLPAAPILAIALLSRNPNHFYLGNQYTAGVVAPMFAATALAVGRLPQLWRVTVGRIAMAASLVVLVLFSPSPLSRLFLQNATWSYGWSAFLPRERDDWVRTMVAATVPAASDVVVSVQNSVVTSALTNRHVLLPFPAGVFAPVEIVKPRQRSMPAALAEALTAPAPAERVTATADWAVLDLSQPLFLLDQGCEWRFGRCEDQAFVAEFEAALARLPADFDLVFNEDRLQIWRRRTP